MKMQTLELLAAVQELAAGEEIGGDVVGQGLSRVGEAEGALRVGKVLDQQLVVLASPFVPLVRRGE